MLRLELPLAAAPAPAHPVLSELTTFRIGGCPSRLVDATDQQALVGAIVEADKVGRPLLVMGGGSNLLAAEDLGELTVVRYRSSTATAKQASGGLELQVQAGASWDALVALTVERGWAGLAALSGIPGSVGATAVQNVGAYGAEVARAISALTAIDRLTGQVVRLDRDDLGFAYRDSALKRSVPQFGGMTPRWVVTDVSFRLQADQPEEPVCYVELAAALGVRLGEPAPLAAVRQAVLTVRRSKGMVLDPADHDTWSAGSFFTNPLITLSQAASLPPGAPRYQAANGLVKVSAAWLISAAGVRRGQGLESGAAATASGKHVLALTNRGGATREDVLALADWIAARVRAQFGIQLSPEPVLVPPREGPSSGA
ncbi:MAG: UDP-N-acetylmuramate dehydrogenase [Bifidobacteriaceae bacterium]|nr:UDP-N-acetylmuramate dehydrogenase [Bifidobacteriaceae bacterium]